MKPTPVGPYTLPVGSLVVVSPKGVHDDPAIYSSPDSWNPNNFFNALPRPSCQYISFGSGEHRCKGEKIASYEAKIVIGKIIRKYRIVRISPGNGLVEPDYAKPSAGLPHAKTPFIVRLEPRSPAAKVTLSNK